MKMTNEKVTQHNISKLVRKYVEGKVEGGEDLFLLHHCGDSFGILREALFECKKIVEYHNGLLKEAGDEGKPSEATGYYKNGKEYNKFISMLLEWWFEIQFGQNGSIGTIGYLAQELKSKSKSSLKYDVDNEGNANGIYLPLEPILKQFYLVYGMLRVLLKDIDTIFQNDNILFIYTRSILYTLVNGLNKSVVTGEYALKLATENNIEFVSLWIFYMDIQKDIAPYMALLFNTEYKQRIGIKLESKLK